MNLERGHEKRSSGVNRDLELLRCKQMNDGVGGIIVTGPTGSRAILWTDLATSGKNRQAGGRGLSWEEEFGQPLKAGFDLFAALIVVKAHGNTADKLFDDLVGVRQAQ